MTTHDTASCRSDELPELLDLANRIFRGRQPGDMGREYPLLFGEDNLDQLRVARLDGRIVAHVGICLRDAVILGCRIRAASIGSVCTDPDYRGRGIASELMADARRHSLERGASLMLISGGRGLYHRLGYVEVGRFSAASAPAGPLPEGLELRPVAGEELDAIIRMHQREPVRFLRPRADWERLLAAGTLMNQAADLLVVRRAGQPAAYLGVRLPAERREGERTSPQVAEFGGSRAAVAAALPAVAARYGAPEARLMAHVDDAEWAAELEARGWRSRAAAFSGTLGILDIPEFFRAIEPYLAERTGGHWLSLEPEAAGLTLRAGGEAARLRSMGEVTALVFGGETEEARRLPELPPAIAERLRSAFPMPLLWYGYNYV